MLARTRNPSELGIERIIIMAQHRANRHSAVQRSARVAVRQTTHTRRRHGGHRHHRGHGLFGSLMHAAFHGVIRSAERMW